MVDFLTSLNNRTALSQLIKYGLVGGAVNVVGYILYLFLSDFLKIEPKLSMSILYFIGVFLGYVGHKEITFSHKSGFRKSGVKFISVHLIGYFIDLLLLYVFVDLYDYPHQYIQAIAIVIVAGFLFFGFKFFVFAVSKGNGRETI